MMLLTDSENLLNSAYAPLLQQGTAFDFAGRGIASDAYRLHQWRWHLARINGLP